MFIDQMKKELYNDGQNLSITENGARGYKSTGKALVDLNFKVASLRNASDDDILALFMDAFYENEELAMKWLFFARDVREGLGERRLFKVIIQYLAHYRESDVNKVIQYIPEYGRWDDYFVLLNTYMKDKVISILRSQLYKDVENWKAGTEISLLAKWLPSENASSKETKKLALKLCKSFGLTPRLYRVTLSNLRKYLKVVEVDMSHRDWDKINYSAVPSKANLKYNKAFLRNDEERRREFLSKVESGDEKINAGTLYPHDIVLSYMKSADKEYWNYTTTYHVDQTLESLWKALPNTVNGNQSTIVVADGSGSMLSGSVVPPLAVANALAIYFAERCNGEFKDKYITFSEHPRLVDMSSVHSLAHKLMIAEKHSEVANTNIEAVFDLILKTAIAGEMRQEDIPANVLIISDMEFDGCSYPHDKSSLFDNISKKFEMAGYKLPRLVFWNVASRTGTIPMTENENGVALVSGFSVHIAKMVLSGKLDPYEVLVEQLMSERYTPITLD